MSPGVSGTLPPPTGSQLEPAPRRVRKDLGRMRYLARAGISWVVKVGWDGGCRPCFYPHATWSIDHLDVVAAAKNVVEAVRCLCREVESGEMTRSGQAFREARHIPSRRLPLHVGSRASTRPTTAPLMVAVPLYSIYSSFSNETFPQYSEVRSSLDHIEIMNEGNVQHSYNEMQAAGFTPELIADVIAADARRLAGRPDQLARRASIYRDLYIESGRNFIFPLIAAHGAVWGCWYLIVGQLFARVFNLVDWRTPPSHKRVESFDRFVDAIKVINSDVMIECYITFHLSRTLGRHPITEARIAPSLIELLLDMHTATREGQLQSLDAQRRLYECFFRHEQERVAAPAVSNAFAQLDWPAMHALSRKPWVWLAYFHKGRSLNFKDFSHPDERIEKGLVAFDRAAELGWANIELLLLKNPLFPGSLKVWTSCANLWWRGIPFSTAHRLLRECRDY